MEHAILPNGVSMPLMGYGTFQISNGEECQHCVSQALKLGYRLFDTAAAYGNESSIGAAVAQSEIPREEIFLTTRLWLEDSGYHQTLSAFNRSLKKLETDYIDLYLIHHPFGDYYSSWRALEHLYREGWVRAIGVSNFYPDRLVDLCMNSDIPPMVNQVELHPFFQQKEALAVMEEYQVIPQAWGPLCEGQKDIFNNKVLQKIAGRYKKTPAQVVLRWHFQRGISAIPRSVRKDHMAENLDIHDFSLTQRDMDMISPLDIGHSEIIDHRCAYTARQLNGLRLNL